MERKGSLPCLEELAPGPYSEPDESTPYTHPIPLRFVLIHVLPLHLRLVFSNFIFPLVFLSLQFSSLRATCSATP
jgi:hypothetical protein